MEFAIYTISVRGIFSTHYEIYQDDELIYRVEKPSFFAFREMNFIDLDENNVLNIYRHSTFFNYKFEIFQDGESIGTIEKDGVSNYYTSSSIYGEHSVQGDLFNSEYTVFDESDEIAKVSKKRFRSHKKYGIAIIKGKNELYVLAMIIALSIVNSRKKKK